MKRIVNSLLLIFSIIIINTGLQGQSLEITRGQYLYRSKIESGNTKYVFRVFDNETINKVRLNFQPLRIRNNVFSLTFGSYRLSANYGVGEESDRLLPNLTLSGGSGKTRSFLLGLGYGYEIGKGRFRFLPCFQLSYEYSVETWEPGYRGTSIRHRYVVDKYSESNPGSQVLTEFSLRYTYRIVGGLNFILETSAIFGYRPIMYMDAEYSVDGVYIERARFYNDSSGFNIMIGALYDFGWKKD